MRKVGDLNVNDGGGLYDNEGLCDSLILDCNSAVKSLFSANYIQFCNLMVQMVQKLANLMDGIKNDMESRDKHIKELSDMLDDMVEQRTGLPVDRGNNNGGETVGE